MKSVIGLIPLYDDEKDSYWMLPGYMKVIERCGAFPVMLPLTDDQEELDTVFNICSGLLFTGGHDVEPELYKAVKTDKCGETCRMRDDMESYLLGKALEKDMSVLGICRGIQFMNAYLGGTLYQDLETEYDCKVEHHMKPPYDVKAHMVSVYPHTLLASIIGDGEHEVNSYHHQAIKDIADGIEIMAVSEDGLVEAISVKDKSFAVGVQWHPEFSYERSEESVKLVQAFVNACNH